MKKGIMSSTLFGSNGTKDTLTKLVLSFLGSLSFA